VNRVKLLEAGGLALEHTELNTGVTVDTHFVIDWLIAGLNKAVIL